MERDIRNFIALFMYCDFCNVLFHQCYDIMYMSCFLILLMRTDGHGLHSYHVIWNSSKLSCVCYVSVISFMYAWLLTSQMYWPEC